MQKSCPICSSGVGEVCENCFEEFVRIESELNLKYVDKTIALFAYDGVLKAKMLDFKFNHEYAWGEILAKIMYKEFVNRGYDANDFDLVTFIPSDPIRFLKRGFNQAKIIAKHFSKLSGIPIKSTLYREKIEKESHKITGQKRKYLKHSFNTKDSRLKEAKRVIIIDDIITTGQTVSEAAKRIKLVDDIEVWALCLLGDFI